MANDTEIGITKVRLRRDCITSMWVGAALAIALGALSIYLACAFAPQEQDRYLNLAILAAGAAFGWLLGTFLSPGTAVESKRFGAVAQAVSAFLSGYLLAKFDRIIEELLKPDRLLNGFNQLSATRIAFFVVALIAAMLPTYIARVYLFEWPTYLNDLFTKPAIEPDPKPRT